MADPTPSLDKNANAPKGEPRQALSGGGSETQAGSDQGGSRAGSDDADETGESAKGQAQPEGGFKPAPGSEPSAGSGANETSDVASPDGDAAAATDAVNNTGEPDQASGRTDIEKADGGDVDAATG